MKKRPSVYYVDNKKLFTEMVTFRTAYMDAKHEGNTPPRVSDYVGESILKIATGLASKSNFIGYSYKDEMISDGFENCLCYLHNFNPDKSSNPFAYFTQIIYYAFLRRITKEKKQLYIKIKSFENSIVNNTLIDTAQGDDSHYGSAYMNVDGKMVDLINKFEAKRPAVAKKKTRGVEKFFDVGVVNE